MFANRPLWNSEEPHGLRAAGVLAAAKDGQAVHGVAHEATILALRADTDCEYGIFLAGENIPAIANSINYAVDDGAKVISISLELQLSSPALESAIKRGVEAGVVVILSAQDNYQDVSRVPSNLEELNRGLLIISGAHDSRRDMAVFANRAGATAASYLAALGMSAFSVDSAVGEVKGANGSSIAGAVIAGAAALLAQAFPNLTGRQIVELLLNSADDAGDPGTDKVFGRGILNIERALQRGCRFGQDSVERSGGAAARPGGR